MRSGAIVVAVCETGIVAPDFSGLPLAPGWQSRKYSPISDWGRLSQKASERKRSKPCWVSSMSTFAW